MSMIRSVFENVDEIWLSEMPNVEELYRMCLDVYLCREFGMLEMEEYIFHKLSFILRSTEVIVAITRDPRSRYDGRFILR